MANAFRDLREIFDEFWSPPEAFLLDAGSGAEALIAKVRLGLTFALLVIPFASLI